MIQLISFITSFIIFYGIDYTLHKYLNMASNHIYFLLHFIVNLFITITILQFFGIFFQDPLGIRDEYYNSQYNNIYLCYPILASLHTFHFVKSLKNIKADEIAHHLLTYIFWYLVYYFRHPIYIFSLITMSGIPGGITYLMLFLQKCNIYFTPKKEKYFSYLLNKWIRSPLTIVFATIYLVRYAYIDYEFINFAYILFVCAFTVINGIHFAGTITESYYKNN
jgi:hypothetical protein